MKHLRDIIANAPLGVAIGDDPWALDTIHDNGCAAAIWLRDVPADVVTWLNDLAPKHLPKGRLVLQPGAVAQAVGHLFDIADVPNGSERVWLENDIITRTTEFAASLKAPYLRLRLDIVDTNACRKFHVDAITARLICTYRGTGTQYGIGTRDVEPDPIFTVPTASPIVLRGTKWPEVPASGLLHRSPPIEGSGETRLLLVVDPIHDLDDDI